MPPEEQMLAALASTRCQGTFEGHVTTRATDAATRERFQRACGELGVKPVLIDLPEGVEPSQPMTASYHRGDVLGAAGELAEVARKLRDRGFPVVRVKLEAVTTNDGIPEADTDPQPAERYFEYHVKLRLPATPDEGSLNAVCVGHAAKVSRNAFKTDPAGVSERFVTLRAYGVGRTTAEGRLDALLADLVGAGFDVLNKQKEYSLFDSHVRLDAGWIDPPAEGTP